MATFGFRRTSIPLLYSVLCLLIAGLATTSSAQTLTPVLFGPPPGVYLDADGVVRHRQTVSKEELAAMRARAKAARDGAKDQQLAYMSLPRLFAQVRALRESHHEVPEELRYLGGLTQVRYVFAFPSEHDLVIAGPAEPWHVARGHEDVVEYVAGTRTGRPILQLDDLIVALRTAREGNGKLFGCGIYPSPDSIKIADDIAQRMASATRAQRMEAMRTRLGPQEVRIFGTRNDTRMAFVCVAADYELKRFAMGLDRAPGIEIGNGVDHSRSAANKFWFEASYEPLLVSKDGNSFEVRGQRLAVRAGQFDFDPRGATEKAKTFAEKFTKNLPALSAAVPLFAELQNVADEALVANLLRRDRLPQKVGWDDAWLMDEAACPVATVPVPRKADTLVGYTNGSLVAGGVMLTLAPSVADSARRADADGSLDAAREHAIARASAANGAALGAQSK